MNIDEKKLKFYRLSKNLTIDEAAEALGISRQTLQNYEQNSLKIPVSLFIKMVKLYELDSVTLYGVEDMQISDFEFDISPYYLIKLFAQLELVQTLEKEQLFSDSEIDKNHFAERLRLLVGKYISTIISQKPELATELESEFKKDTDFEQSVSKKNHR